MHRDLNGKRIVVVGATGGLGTEVCRALAAKGSQLVLVARDHDRLAALSVDGVLVVEDLTQRDAGKRIVDRAIDAYGGIDGIINVAGEVAFGPLSECTDEAMERMFAVHVLGPLRLIRAAIPHLAPGAFLANVSAVTAEYPTAGMLAYSASKAAITAADRALAKELRRNRISVIDLRPPHMNTELAQHAIEGKAPPLPPGLPPKTVAARLVRAIENDEPEVGSRDFSAHVSASAP